MLMLKQDTLNECLSQLIKIDNETTYENENLKDEVEEKKKIGRKPLIGGLSSDTFFYAISCTPYMLRHDILFT